jgi:hypothetical protein
VMAVFAPEARGSARQPASPRNTLPFPVPLAKSLICVHQFNQRSSAVSF